MENYLRGQYRCPNLKDVILTPFDIVNAK